YEGIAEAEEKSSLLVRQLRRRDRRALLRALQAQLALASALVEVAGRDQRQSAPEGTVGVGIEGGNLIERPGQVRIGPQIGGGFLGFRFVDADAAGEQSRIGGFLGFRLVN